MRFPAGTEEGVMLAPHTTYQIGGPADYFYRARSKGEFAAAISAAREEGVPYFILGTGANILIGDKGFRGLVIKNEATEFRFDDTHLVAESGAVIADLIEMSRDRGLSGLEHFVGIPSTVGGALWQNLHFLAPDRQSTLYIESVLESAEILDEDGEIKTVGKDFFQFGYDTSVLHAREIFVTEATFLLSPKDKGQIDTQMRENLSWREEKQPQLRDFPSCGSVFKKIEGVGAGRLIDEAGLKGHTIGGAQISPKHANYIVNLGGATASDVRALVALAQETVASKLGYRLEPEIRFVGEF